MKYYIPFLIIIVSFCSCSEFDDRKVIEKGENTSEEQKEIKTFTVADLPIHIDSTSYLIHPIGNYVVRKGRTKYFDSEDYEVSNSSAVSMSQSKNKISGNLSNVKFQHLDSSELKSLTDKTLKINSMLFLRDIYKKTNRGYFIYSVIDEDTNSDGKLNTNDLKSLYISNLNGSGFRKLSPHRQELDAWKTILEADKLFFKSIEDLDKNGEFDKKDKLHYFYLDLKEENSEVVEYYPI